MPLALAPSRGLAARLEQALYYHHAEMKYASSGSSTAGRGCGVVVAVCDETDAADVDDVPPTTAAATAAATTTDVDESTAAACGSTLDDIDGDDDALFNEFKKLEEEEQRVH